MPRRRKAHKIQHPIPWWIDGIIVVLSLAIAVILLDFRVVSKVTQYGEIVGEAFGSPVDFAPLLASLKPLLLMAIFVLWLKTIITIRKVVGRIFTVADSY